MEGSMVSFPQMMLGNSISTDEKRKVLIILLDEGRRGFRWVNLDFYIQTGTVLVKIRSSC